VARLAAAGLLGLGGAVALGSCGGEGEAVGGGTITRSISVPTVTESVTVTGPGAAVTETVTVTETAPGAGVTVTLTQTTPAVTETVTLTETTPAATETVTLTETAPAAATTEPPVTVTLTETLTVTEATAVSPAAAAAAGAVAGSEDEAITSSEWGWILFGLLAAAVAITGAVLLVRRRRAHPA
jgi:hypothetical protein